MGVKPWAEGPLELLRHGFQHLSLGTDFDRRMAMISVDNSVEVMVKTYLSLPRRITGMPEESVRRPEGMSFPALLRHLEKFAPDKLIGLDPSEMEWFHLIRNRLYHEGNGITVDISAVRVYADTAAILLMNLFGLSAQTPIGVTGVSSRPDVSYSRLPTLFTIGEASIEEHVREPSPEMMKHGWLPRPTDEESFDAVEETHVNSVRSDLLDALDSFLMVWFRMERRMNEVAEKPSSSLRPRRFSDLVSELAKRKIIDDKIKRDFARVKAFRNRLVHNPGALSREQIETNTEILRGLRNHLNRMARESSESGAISATDP